MTNGKYQHKTGIITLYSSNNHFLVKRRYSTIWQRNHILEQWKAFYQDRFKNYYYQIAPDLTTAREKALV